MSDTNDWVEALKEAVAEFETARKAVESRA